MAAEAVSNSDIYVRSLDHLFNRTCDHHLFLNKRSAFIVCQGRSLDFSTLVTNCYWENSHSREKNWFLRLFYVVSDQFGSGLVTIVIHQICY